MKKKIEDAIKETIDWVDSNQDADKMECEYQLKILKEVANPIIVYADSDKNNQLT